MKLSRFYLGLDSSTQSLTAVLIDFQERSLLHRASVHFDSELPAWGTEAGQLPNPDPTVGHAPPLLWLDALERVFELLVEHGAPLDQLAGVSVSGQQHGSVYLNHEAATILGALSPDRALSDQLRPALSRPIAPIWTDSSTSEQCAQIRQALGGIEACTRLTGSDIFERFTGPQIRKFAQQEPDAYSRTASIALVSSFMTSVLSGTVAPIDWGDGSGMNLMDLTRKCFSDAALEATAPDLARRLPGLAPPWQVVGTVAPWLSRRFGVAGGCRVVVGSGDNPCSMIGNGLIENGQAAISFGTSDTYFQLGPHIDGRSERSKASIPIDPSGAGHVFLAPTGSPMALLCFRNGSLARERVRDHFALDWQSFSELATSRPPAQSGFFLPWFEPEIIPRGVSGPRSIGRLDWQDISQESAARHCRAILETQLLSMRCHSGFLGERPERLRITGGASQNEVLLQLSADVFQAEVETVETPDSAALGAALRAAHGASAASSSTSTLPWETVVEGFCKAQRRFEPDHSLAPVYDLAQQQLAQYLEDL